MKPEINTRLISEFSTVDLKIAISEIESLTLQHAMSDSQSNLDTILFAILQLSQGDLAKLKNLVSAAKHDFRDVIYWASLSEVEENT